MVRMCTYTYVLEYHGTRVLLCQLCHNFLIGMCTENHVPINGTMVRTRVSTRVLLCQLCHNFLMGNAHWEPRTWYTCTYVRTYVRTAYVRPLVSPLHLSACISSRF
jgi:hypothetical protein